MCLHTFKCNNAESRNCVNLIHITLRWTALLLKKEPPFSSLYWIDKITGWMQSRYVCGGYESKSLLLSRNEPRFMTKLITVLIKISLVIMRSIYCWEGICKYMVMTQFMELFQHSAGETYDGIKAEAWNYVVATVWLSQTYVKALSFWCQEFGSVFVKLLYPSRGMRFRLRG